MENSLSLRCTELTDSWYFISCSPDTWPRSFESGPTTSMPAPFLFSPPLKPACARSLIWEIVKVRWCLESCISFLALIFFYLIFFHWIDFLSLAHGHSYKEFERLCYMNLSKCSESIHKSIQKLKYLTAQIKRDSRFVQKIELYTLVKGTLGTFSKGTKGTF